MTVVTPFPRRHMLGVAEVADQLGVHKHTIYRLVSRGELPACRVATRVLIDPMDLDALLNRSKIA